MADESKDRRVACATHGTTLPTFACCHVAAPGATDLGLAYDWESGEVWPDLVCDACSEEPPWTRETALQRIRVLCTQCWEDAFARNTPFHHDDPEAWLHEALHRAQRKQDQWTARFEIGRPGQYRYGLDDSPPWLGFGPAEGRYDVICEPTVVGTWSARAGTWLWGWANDWWQPSLTRAVVKVKRAGERLGIERLWRSTIAGDESVGWLLSSAVLDLLPVFEGIYRAPDANGSLFLAVRNTRWIV